MVLDIKQFYGVRLGAIDGDIGQVNDFYFDDDTWTIRYIMADTGSWLADRAVLLLPRFFGTHAFGKFDRWANVFAVKLTRKQIEGAPAIENRRPLSRQYEKAYYSYYGGPNYWEGGAWSVSDAPSPGLLLANEDMPEAGRSQREDIHLRSAKAITGYNIQAADGWVGSVSSFVVDDNGWAIREIVTETGPWYEGKTILLRPDNISRISHDESTIFVNLSKHEIEETRRDDGVRSEAGRR